jgi:endonuclease/exonuclease/phosphatase family metal-dependent hydrolase
MKQLKVLTLNTWNQEGPYEDREPLIKSWIRKLDPDLIGFQEIGSEQTSQLLDELDYHYQWAGHADSGISVGARWKIDNCVQSDLPGAGNESIGGILIGCHVHTPFGIVPFANTTTYFPMLNEGWKREIQMPSLYDATRIFRIRNGFPVILVGDFNAEPDSAEIRYLKGLQSIEGHSAYFCDAWERAGDGTSGATWTTGNPYSKIWGLPDRRIDYVFIGSPGVQGPGAVLTCRVVCDEAVNDIWPSDHFGVYAELSLE